MEQGEEAVKELAELDKNSGMTGKKRQVERNLGEVRPPRESRSQPADVQTNVAIQDVLTDDQLASQRLAQAQKMAAEAKALLAESDRLMKEAAALRNANTEQLQENTRNVKPRKTKKAAAKVN
jgi:hypothetical protein